jgi:hypothetical protein
MFCLAGVFVFLTFNPLLAQSNDVDTSTAAFSAQILNQLSGFESIISELQTNRLRTPNESLDKLKAAMEQMKATVKFFENARSINRKECARLWFDFLAAMDERIDPNFGTPDYLKTNDAAINLVPPPDGSSGIIYASGTDPSALKDPTARAEYEAMLKTNKEHINNVFFQSELQRVSQRAMRVLSRFIQSSYTLSEPDKKELNEIVGKSKLSASRKLQIQSMVLR